MVPTHFLSVLWLGGKNEKQKWEVCVFTSRWTREAGRTSRMKKRQLCKRSKSRLFATAHARQFKRHQTAARPLLFRKRVAPRPSDGAIPGRGRGVCPVPVLAPTEAPFVLKRTENTTYKLFLFFLFAGCERNLCTVWKHRWRLQECWFSRLHLQIRARMCSSCIQIAYLYYNKNHHLSYSMWFRINNECRVKKVSLDLVVIEVRFYTYSEYSST